MQKQELKELEKESAIIDKEYKELIEQKQEEQKQDEQKQDEQKPIIQSNKGKKISSKKLKILDDK